MKTKLTLFFYLTFIVSINANDKFCTSTTSAFQDYNLEQLIINTYPTIDANNDGTIETGEMNGSLVTGNVPSVLTLNFDYATFGPSGIDFTGIEHFEIRNFRFTGNTHQGNYIRAFNLDLAKLGGVLAGNVNRILDEFHLSGLEFLSLNLQNARPIRKLHFFNCGADSNLEQLPNMPDYTALNTLEIVNTSLFATLNLGARNGLKTFIFRSTYIEGLDLSNCSTLETLFVDGVGELKNVTLPNAALNLKNLTINGMPKLNNLDIAKYSNLEKLTMKTSSGFPNNGITTLDFQTKAKLKVLELEHLKSLASISVLQNTAITDLSIVGINNNITLIDLSTLTQLKNLTLSANSISNLDLSNNTALEKFDGFASQFVTINFGSISAIKELSLNSNQLTKIDIKNMTNLERLELDDNNLVAINVSSNTKLEWLRCQRNNTLRLVNMANGNNANMNEWDLKAALLDQNPLLTCILVDANVQNNIPIQWQKDMTASYSLDDEIGYTDANFKSELLNYTEIIDVDGNGKIASCEAEQFKGVINVASKSLQSLSGIEAFKNIVGLVVDNNNLGALDVTQNTKLNFLYAENAGLNTINFQNLADLNDLSIPNNNLSSISFMGTLNLTLVSVNNNKLTGLPISQLNKLSFLNCSDNELSSLTVTSNPNLETLFCRNNKFVSLASKPTTINLSNNTKLVNFDARNNVLTELDISANPNIVQFIVNNNSLTKLNVANGNNANITNFVTDGNTTLNCIQVDVNFTPSNFWLKDQNTVFSDNCATLSIKDFNFDELVKVYPNPFSNQLTISNTSESQIFGVQIFNYLGKKVLSSKKETINTNLLDKGIFLAKIIFKDDKIVFKKIIKN